jgi:hypothetical protein
MKITQYVTATAGDFGSLDEKVADLIAKGFQPYGNPYSARNTSRGLSGVFSVSQAMVKCESDAEIPATGI